MPYRKKARKKFSKSILSGLFAGAGSVGAFALGMAVVGSFSENFGPGQSQDPGYTQQSGKQQADASGSQFDDTPSWDNGDEGNEGQGSFEGGPGQGDGPSDGDSDSNGDESSLPGNDQVATGDGQPGNQGNNGSDPSEDGNSSGGTAGFGGGGSGGGYGTLANEPDGESGNELGGEPGNELGGDLANGPGGGGPANESDDEPANEQDGDTLPDDANPPEDEIVGLSNEGPLEEDISEIEDVGDYYPEETLVANNLGTEDEGDDGSNQITADVMSVPEPGAASILVLGMLGAFGLARSRKNRN